MPDAETVPPVYVRVLDVVRQIPHGQVATYGQIAQIAGGCTPRMVGYCLASLGRESEGNVPDDVPWQRVINAQGKSARAVSGLARCCNESCWKGRAWSSATPTGSVSASSGGWILTNLSTNRR